MVRHIVMWRLKQEIREEGKLRHAQPIEALLEAMRTGIPGLLRVEIGWNEAQSPDRSDLVLYSEFEDWAALARYDAHPLHVELKGIIGALRDERRVVDYEV